MAGFAQMVKQGIAILATLVSGFVVLRMFFGVGSSVESATPLDTNSTLGQAWSKIADAFNQAWNLAPTIITIGIFVAVIAAVIVIYKMAT